MCRRTRLSGGSKGPSKLRGGEFAYYNLMSIVGGASWLLMMVLLVSLLEDDEARLATFEDARVRVEKKEQKDVAKQVTSLFISPRICACALTT